MKAPVYNVYLPYFYSYDKGHYVNVVKVSLPQSKYFQKILTSRHNFLITIVDEGIDLISPDIFKLPQKKYFLYNKSNIIQQTFITEINKPILVYGSIGFLVKKRQKMKRFRQFCLAVLQILKFNKALIKMLQILN